MIMTRSRETGAGAPGRAGWGADGDQLANLIGSIRSVTTRRMTWSRTADVVAERLSRNLPSPDVLTHAQREGNREHAQTHLLHAEADGSFSVVALVLRPGQSTPIHDHVTWCAFGVIQGAEREERYAQGQAGHLELAAISANLVRDVDGLAPPGDIHLVRNDDVPAAISLHIYGTDVSRLGTSVRRVYGAPVRSGRVLVRPPTARRPEQATGDHARRRGPRRSRPHPA
jgi:3-mercaptopropionate dioxygenase